MVQSVATARIGPFRFFSARAILPKCLGTAHPCATAPHSANCHPIFMSCPAPGRALAVLKAIRDQAQAEADRAQAMAESAGQQAITLAMVRKFARTARERIRIDGGGYRPEHLRALAQRVEVADGEVRIMGSKGDLLRTLAAASGVKSATPGVRSSILKWRMGWDSNPRYAYTHGGFQDRCLKPLGHPSVAADLMPERRRLKPGRR